MTVNNGFFAVGQQTFIQACDLGINPACAFLVLACGTGKDNTTTRWSAEAVGNHVGVRWNTAKDAIERLCAAGIVVKGGKPARPSYKLQKEGQFIWLPRTLIEGAANEAPPVTKMRQTQDAMALRLLVELYLSQNLREDGGISTKVVYKTYERRKAMDYGSYTVWDFTGGTTLVAWGGAAKPHWHKLTPEEVSKKEINEGVDFFRRFFTLQNLGLVEWVPCLYDGPQGEPMHPLTRNTFDVELELYTAATEAAFRMLGESYSKDVEGIAVPVQTHIAEAALIGVARLKYRPHTSLTSAWWAEHRSLCNAFTRQYQALAVPKVIQNLHAIPRNGTSDAPF